MCVMASRHVGGLIVLTRDHIAQTLDDYVPSAGRTVDDRTLQGAGIGASGSLGAGCGVEVAQSRQPRSYPARRAAAWQPST